MTSRKAQRTARLIHLLSERRVIHLSEAAILLGVSEMTVRRDIATNQGQIAYLGGHILAAAEIDTDAPYELATAADSHAAAKREACLHAVRKIRPDETIFIDCGTRDEFNLRWGARMISDELKNAGVEHLHEEFEDGHMGVNYRFERSLTWLGERLER